MYTTTIYVLVQYVDIEREPVGYSADICFDLCSSWFVKFFWEKWQSNGYLMKVKG